MTLTSKPADELLDLPPWIGQRSSTFRFVLRNGVTGQIKQELHPIRGSAVLEHDTTRTVKRQLKMTLERADTAAVNAITDRVDVSMIVGGVREYPLGRYMFTAPTRLERSSGAYSNVVLLDEMQLVDQQLSASLVPRQMLFQQLVFQPEPLYTQVPQRIAEALTGLPIQYDIEPSPFRSSGVWAIGTQRGKALEDLSIDGDYWSPWFDNLHVLRFIRTFDPADIVPGFDFDSNHRVLRDSITGTDDLLTAPNRFIVISNGLGSTDTPLVGVYNVPASAPHSEANRGFVIPSVLERQGITSEQQAIDIAANLGQRAQIVERVELSTPPDPRHDGYDTIVWQGRKWLEIAWSLPLSEGAAMRHTLRRAYPAT